VGEQVRMGIITAEERSITPSAMSSPVRSHVRPAQGGSHPGGSAGWRHLLLCSDGLSGMVSDQGIEELIRGNHDDLEKCADLLIEAALEGGGKDNVTVIWWNIWGVRGGPAACPCRLMPGGGRRSAGFDLGATAICAFDNAADRQ